MNAKFRLWSLGLAGAVAVAFATTIASAQTTWHVDAANACPGSGSEADPFCAIQPAINAAGGGDEILVAPGTYSEAINFNGKAIHLHSSRGPEVTIIDASGLNTTVVSCTSGEGPNTILDGFTVTGGSANQGGGMLNLNASTTILNCIFTGNIAALGGGMYNELGSNPTVTGCLFEDNTATNSGGGIYNVNFSTSTVNNSTFAGNSAGNGGAIFNSGGTFCHSFIAGSTFCENTPNDITGTWHDNGGNEFLDECPEECGFADLNCDGSVGVADLLILLSEWGPCDDPDDCPADLDGNGSVGVSDLLLLLANWG